MSEVQHDVNYKNVLIEGTMSRAYLKYSATVIMHRALPDARDGFKPVHRRIMFGMHTDGTLPNKPYKKVAKTVGLVMSEFHPHGDSAISDALVRMGQPFSMRYPLIEGQGNFGSITGDPAAAMRYIEARMSHGAVFMSGDVDKRTVDFMPNYDDSRDEPVVLPAALPNLIVNGTSGIAVGMASMMAPHNLREVGAAINSYIDDRKVGVKSDVESLLQHIQGPDFPLGGVICGTDGFKQAMRTGRGCVTVRAEHEVYEINGRNVIRFHSIPYMLNTDDLVAKIKEHIKSGNIEGISDIRDESDHKVQARIIVELKKAAIPEVVANQLFKYTPLQSNFNYNSMAIHKMRPTMMTLVDLVDAYVDHRVSVVTRRLGFDLDKAQARAHILRGLIVVQNNAEAVVKVIRGAGDQALAKASLKSIYGLDDTQVDAVVAMRLGQLTALDCTKLTTELTGLEEEIARIQAILSDDNEVLEVVRADLNDVVTKLGDERRSRIAPAIGAIETEDLIPDDEMVVTVSKEGYIKRVNLDTYRSQARGGTGVNGANLKDEDYVTGIYKASNKSYLVFFTTSGRAHFLKVWNIPEGSRTGKGKALVNFLSLAEGETVQAVTVVREFDDDHYFLFATKAGTINKMKASLFANTPSRGINAINIAEGDRLVQVIYGRNEGKIVLATEHGMACTFEVDQFRACGRNSAGVKGINLGFSDSVVSMIHLNGDNTKILTITENGQGKRTNPDDYRVTKRGGKGVTNIKITAKTGKVVFASAISDDNDILVTTKSGIVIRTRVSEISEQGRAAQGVRVINLKDGDIIIDAARI